MFFSVNLPKEILVLIFRYFTINELTTQLALCCQLFKSIIWEVKCLRKTLIISSKMRYEEAFKFCSTDLQFLTVRMNSSNVADNSKFIEKVCSYLLSNSLNSLTIEGQVGLRTFRPLYKILFCDISLLIEYSGASLRTLTLRNLKILCDLQLAETEENNNNLTGIHNFNFGKTIFCRKCFDQHFFFREKRDSSSE